MENASKALIIAGAILLAIAIIGVGMFVFNNVYETITGSADMSSQEILAYNQKYTAYAGENVKGAKVKSLCDTVNTNNLAAEDGSKQIAVNYGTVYEGENTQVASPVEKNQGNTTSGVITGVKNQILSGRTYRVTIATDPDSGLVSAIGIQLNN